MQLYWEHLALFAVFTMIYGLLLGFLAGFNKYSVKWVVRKDGLHFESHRLSRHIEAGMWLPVYIAFMAIGGISAFLVVAALSIFYLGDELCLTVFKRSVRQRENLMPSSQEPTRHGAKQ